MPRRISVERRKRVIDLWMNGRTLEQIQSETGLSLDSVHNIVRAEGAAVPDIPELRELNLNLKEAGISLEEAKEGVDLLQRIKELGIPLDRLSEALGERLGNIPGETVLAQKKWRRS